MGINLKVIKNRKFVSLWISQLLSQLTINMLSFLILVRLYEQTGSSIATSLLWISYTIPALIVGPFAAALVDWIDRRKTLMITNFLQATIVLIYAFVSGRHIIFLPYALVFTYSFLNQFYVPAEAATLPSVVEKKDLPEVNGLFFLTQQASLMLGFGLSGILVKLVGFKVSAIIAAVNLFIAFISVSFLPKQKSRKIIFSKDIEDQITKFFKEIVEGYRFIKDNSNILSPFLLLLVLQVLLSVILVSLPVIATQIVKVKANDSGLLIVTPASIGAVAATLSITKMLKGRVRKKNVIEGALALLSLNLIAILFIQFIEGPFKIFASLILFATIGYLFVTSLIPSITFLQEQTPGGLMGRVFGNFWFLASLATLFPVILSGTIADILGADSIILILSFILLTIFVLSKVYNKISI
ncbi:MAG: MFS transporter [Candidatus Woesebacteria bacterium]|nr:MAG: MFS transporter [Candidatus Woesebacteria bacterium]